MLLVWKNHICYSTLNWMYSKISPHKLPQRADKDFYLLQDMACVACLVNDMQARHAQNAEGTSQHTFHTSRRWCRLALKLSSANMISTLFYPYLMFFTPRFPFSLTLPFLIKYSLYIWLHVSSYSSSPLDSLLSSLPFTVKTTLQLNPELILGRKPDNVQSWRLPGCVSSLSQLTASL